MKLRRIPKLSIAAALLMSAPYAHAWDSLIPGSRYISVRAAALGGAFLPLGDDGPAAMFYNPASVAKIRSIQAEPLNLAVTANGGLVSNMGINSYKAYSLSGYSGQLTAAPNIFQGAAGQFVSSFFGKGFSIGVLMSDDFGASSDDTGAVRYRTRYQLIPAASLGVRLAGGIVRLGYSFQWVHQAQGDITVPAGSDLGYNQQLAQGSGLSHNVGAALTLPISYLPQLNLVARNLANTTYTSPSLISSLAPNSTGSPTTDQMSFDTSISIQPKIDSGIFANLIVQLRDITNRSGVSPMGRLCAGLEVSFRDFLTLRGGWGSGYPSAGLGFKLRRGEFGAAWFGEEIGGGYRVTKDSRYMFQFQLRAF